MIRFIRDLRLVPIAVLASACLLALKTADLVLDGGHWLAGDNAPAGDGDASVIRTTPDAPQPPGMKLSWAQQMLNFPNAAGSASTPEIALPRADRANADRPNGDITGSIATATAERDGKRETDAKGPSAGGVGGVGSDGKDAKASKNGSDGKAVAPADGTLIPTNGAALPSGAERAILERLQERRQELETRARELDIRESLIKAAEKRIDARLAELKEVEGRIVAETQQKDEAEAARFKGLVTMYENMKPRDAAKIFDRLDINVLIEVAAKINPRQMSGILAQMSPDMAERLTVELASKAQHVEKNSSAELPKIEGRPTMP